MTDWINLVAIVAGVLTAGANVPQAWKTWKTRDTADLSAKMLLMLFAGLSSWAAYGAFKPDWFVMVANVVSATAVGFVLSVKMRNLYYGKT